ncbi:MAG: methyltransferase [Halioglobus sp.]
MKAWISIPVLSLLCALVWADSDNSFLRDAVNGEGRTAEEVARDSNRKPIETLAFFGLKPNMKVVELLPGGGWYSKILTAALADEGQYYAALGTDRLLKILDVKTTGKTSELTKLDGAGSIYQVDEVDLGITDVDMILTFRNAHNFNAETRRRINNAAFAALKSGGVYGIIDHTKRHMEPVSDWTWRRLDPVMVIQEAVQAGFVFEAYSDLHARAEDELKYDTRHDSLVNESDRFTLKFRKP